MKAEAGQHDRKGVRLITSINRCALGCVGHMLHTVTRAQVSVVGADGSCRCAQGCKREECVGVRVT